MRYKRYTLLTDYSGEDYVTYKDIEIKAGETLYGYCHIPPDGSVPSLFTEDGRGMKYDGDDVTDHGFCHAYTRPLLTSLVTMLPTNSIFTDRAAMVLDGTMESCVEAYLSIEGKISKRWLVDNDIIADFTVGTLIWQHGDTIFSIDSEITSTSEYGGVEYESAHSMMLRGYTGASQQTI